MSADRVAALAEVIWETSRRDEGTISATGANIIAEALIESPALRDLLAEERARALREAADEVEAECSQETVGCYCGSGDWLRARADRETP